jgi:hypothetical protein
VRQSVRPQEILDGAPAEAACQIERLPMQHVPKGLQRLRIPARAPRLHPPQVEAVQVSALRLLDQVISGQ